MALHIQLLYYCPAITAVSRSLHTSIEAVNLTITACLIVAGIAPSILGDLADRIGRRPISLVTLTLYLGANLGLALQNSYTALVVLRCLQSAGASSTTALAYGVIADTSTSAERGSNMGMLIGLVLFPFLVLRAFATATARYGWTLQAVIDGVGVGWCFTIHAVIGAFSVPLFLVPRWYGEEWRGMEKIEGPSMTSNSSATEHEKPGK